MLVHENYITHRVLREAAASSNFRSSPGFDDGIVKTPRSPGTRCPTCAKEGKEVWVIPGRYCGYCGTPCDGDETCLESLDDLICPMICPLEQ